MLFIPALLMASAKTSDCRVALWISLTSCCCLGGALMKGRSFLVPAVVAAGISSAWWGGGGDGVAFLLGKRLGEERLRGTTSSMHLLRETRALLNSLFAC